MAYHSCPMLWINNAPIMEFFEMKRYLDKHPHTAPPYEARRPRFVAFEKYYQATLADFEDMKKTGGK